MRSPGFVLLIVNIVFSNVFFPQVGIVTLSQSKIQDCLEGSSQNCHFKDFPESFSSCNLKVGVELNGILHHIQWMRLFGKSKLVYVPSHPPYPHSSGYQNYVTMIEVWNAGYLCETPFFIQLFCDIYGLITLNIYICMYV